MLVLKRNPEYQDISKIAHLAASFHHIDFGSCQQIFLLIHSLEDEGLKRPMPEDKVLYLDESWKVFHLAEHDEFIEIFIYLIPPTNMDDLIF